MSSSPTGTAPTGSHRILIIGLGTVAETHLRALEATANVTVVGGVDPATPSRELTFNGHDVPVYQDLQQVAEEHDPTQVVIATPTPTHAAVCRDVAELFPEAEILVEKPAADNLSDAHEMLHEIGRRHVVNVAYHMAFSPEVTWARRIVQERSGELGEPEAIFARFSDPYTGEPDFAKKRFGNSWIDSGINALSAIERFAEPVERKTLRRHGEPSHSTYEARITCRTETSSTIEAHILTSWYVTAPSRSTRVRFESGSELTMDHHAVAGCLVEDGSITELFGSDGRVPRRESHYRALYHEYLIEGRPIMSTKNSLRLHHILLED